MRIRFGIALVMSTGLGCGPSNESTVGPANGGAGSDAGLDAAQASDADTSGDLGPDALAPAFQPDEIKALMSKVAKFELGQSGAATRTDWIHAAFYAGLM